MKPFARLLAPALALALAGPGLVVALSACVVGDCAPAMAAMAVAEHDCCPAAPVEVSPDCCPQSLAAPAMPPPLHERRGALAPATAPLLGAPVVAPAAAAGVRSAAAVPFLPLDSLARSCILRI